MSTTLSSPTLQNLVTDTRVQLNQLDPNNSFWRDDELTGYLNDAIRRYFVECVHVNEGYFTIQTGGVVPDLNIIANVETITLPSDCFEVKNVWKKLKPAQNRMVFDPTLLRNNGPRFRS